MSTITKRAGAFLVSLLFITSSVAMASVVTSISANEGQQFLRRAIEFATVEWQSDGEKRVGVPYQWGGRSSLEDFLTAVANESGAESVGVDASGLVIAAARAISPDFKFRMLQGDDMITVSNVNSALLFRWNVVAVDVDSLLPGDLIFFSGASGNIEGVGIYERMAGRHIRFVVASANSGRVVQTSLNLDGDYWATRFAGAGRLVRSEGQ